MSLGRDLLRRSIPRGGRCRTHVLIWITPILRDEGAKRVIGVVEKER